MILLVGLMKENFIEISDWFDDPSGLQQHPIHKQESKDIKGIE
jgi:hypothetical protein